ncbi:hypothetical protein L21SP5_02582 [Salinivirga cyanobacteriivorans]|uniref:Uncharacterized protein n=1 Tax=Salinivirga cyanobacteriivorans TaxID=1307839 RepID=A0A0S2I1R2_9BACT|nr:hypothetical protein [Salinivirga cyanobacteriivorans]ALO16205.1 hypothetical protein L21SP5_02582 [Salinivirga cyanobacteriivorans]
MIRKVFLTFALLFIGMQLISQNYLHQPVLSKALGNQKKEVDIISVLLNPIQFYYYVTQNIITSPKNLALIKRGQDWRELLVDQQYFDLNKFQGQKPEFNPEKDGYLILKLERLN